MLAAVRSKDEDGVVVLSGPKWAWEYDLLLQYSSDSPELLHNLTGGSSCNLRQIYAACGLRTHTPRHARRLA